MSSTVQTHKLTLKHDINKHKQALFNLSHSKTTAIEQCKKRNWEKKQKQMNPMPLQELSINSHQLLHICLSLSSYFIMYMCLIYNLQYFDKYRLLCQFRLQPPNLEKALQRQNVDDICTKQLLYCIHALYISPYICIHRIYHANIIFECKKTKLVAVGNEVGRITK